MSRPQEDLRVEKVEGNDTSNSPTKPNSFFRRHVLPGMISMVSAGAGGISAVYASYQLGGGSEAGTTAMVMGSAAAVVSGATAVNTIYYACRAFFGMGVTDTDFEKYKTQESSRVSAREHDIEDQQYEPVTAAEIEERAAETVEQKNTSPSHTMLPRSGSSLSGEQEEKSINVVYY